MNFEGEKTEKVKRFHPAKGLRISNDGADIVETSLPIMMSLEMKYYLHIFHNELDGNIGARIEVTAKNSKLSSANFFNVFV